MSPALGQGQSVTQAVVVPDTTFDPNKAPMVVALFKPDGTPFLADTATLYTIFTVVWNPMDEDAIEAMLETPNESPWPFKGALFNQVDPTKNGIYANMFGAPGTTGPQLMVKIADLPVGEAVFISPSIIASDDRDPETLLELADLMPELGGVVIASNLDYVDDEAVYVWSIITDGAKIESRLAALEAP